MSGERWLPVPGSGSYEVSDHGKVRSRRRTEPRTLSPYRDPKKGYLSVTIITDEGAPRPVRVHILVLEAFVGPRPTGHQTRHLDGDPDNNHVSNLRWGTTSENSLDLVRHGKHNNARKTQCPKGHPYDAANTWVSGRGWRECRACRRQLKRRERAARRSAA